MLCCFLQRPKAKLIQFMIIGYFCFCKWTFNLFFLGFGYICSFTKLPLLFAFTASYMVNDHASLLDELSLWYQTSPLGDRIKSQSQKYNQIQKARQKKLIYFCWGCSQERNNTKIIGDGMLNHKISVVDDGSLFVSLYWCGKWTRNTDFFHMYFATFGNLLRQAAVLLQHN